MTSSLSLRQLVLLVMLIALVVGAVVMVTFALTGADGSPVGDLMARGTFPWAI